MVDHVLISDRFLVLVSVGAPCQVRSLDLVTRNHEVIPFNCVIRARYHDPTCVVELTNFVVLVVVDSFVVCEWNVSMLDVHAVTAYCQFLNPSVVFIVRMLT